MTKPANSKSLSAALSYIERGWPVLPLHWPSGGVCSCGQQDCSSVGKHPLTSHGVKDATTDRRVVRDWWNENPDANIGLRTGRSSGVLVLDVDARHEGEKSLAALEDKFGMLPKGPWVKTGGG